MTAFETLQMTGAGIVGVAVLYFMYTTQANDSATSKISNSRPDIDKMLGAHYLHEICSGDCSPCEVEFTLISNANSGLPSRIALRWLKDIKSGCATVEQFYAACLVAHRKHEDYWKKKRTL